MKNIYFTSISTIFTNIAQIYGPNHLQLIHYFDHILDTI